MKKKHVFFLFLACFAFVQCKKSAESVDEGYAAPDARSGNSSRYSVHDNMPIFAYTGRPHDPEEVAFGDAEVHVVERMRSTVPRFFPVHVRFHQIVGFQDGLSAHSRSYRVRCGLSRAYLRRRSRRIRCILSAGGGDGHPFSCFHSTVRSLRRPSHVLTFALRHGCVPEATAQPWFNKARRESERSSPPPSWPPSAVPEARCWAPPSSGPPAPAMSPPGGPRSWSAPWRRPPPAWRLEGTPPAGTRPWLTPGGPQQWLPKRRCGGISAKRVHGGPAAYRPSQRAPSLC